MNSLINIENKVQITNSFNGNKAVGPKINSNKHIRQINLSWIPYIAILGFVLVHYFKTLDHTAKNKKHPH